MLPFAFQAAFATAIPVAPALQVARASNKSLSGVLVYLACLISSLLVCLFALDPPNERRGARKSHRICHAFFVQSQGESKGSGCYEFSLKFVSH